MTKAEAPMIGGMISPPTLAAASMPPASAAGKPMRFISGMVTEPVTTTLATDDPLVMPNRPDSTTTTLAGPPV